MEGGPIPLALDAFAQEAAQSLPEFQMYCRMAVQGLVYRCLMFTAFMGGVPPEQRVAQLGALVSRTVQAVIDRDLYALLAVGRR
jgi:hypothetical protein